MAMFESNASSSLHHIGKRTCSSEYSEINDALYKWYLPGCTKNIYPDGSQLKEKARIIAVRFGKSEFKGTNGGSKNGRSDTTSKGLLFVGSLVMSGGTQ